jgi:hypothetical protein
MRSLQLPIARPIVVAMLVVAATGNLARAQREGRGREEQVLLEQARLMIHQEMFKQSILGTEEGAKELRDRFESVLSSRIARLDGLYGLSEGQKKKLLLAGRGDIKHFFDRVEETRKRLPLLADDEDEDSGVLQELETLRRDSRHDLFGEGSILAKTLKKTLTAEQSRRYDQVAREVLVHRHRATLQWVLGTLDETLGLTPPQHQRLEALLVEETRHPRRFGEEDYYGVMFQLGQVSEAKLRPIFTADQWTKLSRQLGEARRKEDALKSGGYLPEDEVASAPAHTNKPGAKPEKKKG